VNAVTPQVDIGVVLKGLTSDPEWFKKYAMAGLVTLVPLVGMLVLVGWLRRVFEAARQGDYDTLPTLNFSEDLSRGVAPFVAVLNLLLPFIVGLVGFGIVGAVVGVVGSAVDQGTNGSGAGGLLTMVMMLAMYAFLFVGIIAMNLAMPEFQRRGYKGEMTPIFSPGVSFRAVKRNLKPYVMVIVGLFVANLMSGIGVFACYIGMFLTMPMGMVVMARLLAQWDAVVEQSEIQAGERAALSTADPV